MIDRYFGSNTEQSLSGEAIENYTVIQAEAKRRQVIGLTTSETLSPYDQVIDYLERVANIDPVVNGIVDRLIEDKEWTKPPSLVICMPVVGTGNQEVKGIRETLLRLREDTSVASADIGILLLVNRPAGYTPDSTAQVAQTTIQDLGLNGIVLETELPVVIGNVAGPFNEEMATKPNEVPIGLIRDLLNIAAMKLAIRESNPLPLLLQMDADFEGFMQGSFADVINAFADRNIEFLQCTSDWDSKEYPRESDFELSIGASLMRELPQILKNALNNASLPTQSRMQILFGEAIQRGIQVPQAERMESIARKGGYGLNRLKHDELDTNVRMSGLINPTRVRSRDNIIFLWNNRRAVRTWQQFREPPISQWTNAFAVVDPVRRSSRIENLNGKSHLTEAVNKTLARFPIPKSLLGVYDTFTKPILDIVKKYLPETDGINFTVQQNGDLYYLQFNF